MGKDYQILIVDDHPWMGALIEAIMEAGGLKFQTIHAEDGEGVR